MATSVTHCVIFVGREAGNGKSEGEVAARGCKENVDKERSLLMVGSKESATRGEQSHLSAPEERLAR